MIIECQACRARFRLDESRIKGKGARIRCRKCGESIIVMKSEILEEKPSAAVGKERFDLRSVLHEPERRASVPSRDEVDDAFERPPPKVQDPETAAQTSKEPLRATASDLGEEVDAAFDRLLFRDREKEQARPEEQEPEPTAGESAEPFAEVSPQQPEEIKDSFDAPLFDQEDLRLPPENRAPPAGDLREAAEKDVLVATTAGEEEPEKDRKSMEFLILDAESPDDPREEGSSAEPTRPFDISEQLSQAPRWTLEEDKAETPPTSHPPPIDRVFADLRTESLQDELAGPAVPDSREEVFAPEPPPPDLPPSKPSENERKPLVVPSRSSGRSRRPSIMILALLFVTLAAGGAYLAFTKTGKDTLRTILPGILSFWPGGKESPRPYKVENPIGFYETGKDMEKLFVIKGAITNQGRSAKSGIRVRAELLDGNHKNIGELTVYAGNVISGLRSENQETIQAAMANRFGEKLSNVDVAPGKSVPFMVVFFDPPEGIEEYRLEALEGE